MHAHVRKLRRHAGLVEQALVYFCPVDPGFAGQERMATSPTHGRIGSKQRIRGVRVQHPCFSLGLAANFIYLIQYGSHRVFLCYGTLQAVYYGLPSRLIAASKSLRTTAVETSVDDLFGQCAFRVLNAQSCKCSVYGYGGAHRQGQPRSPTFARAVVPNHHDQLHIPVKMIL